jgi:hypothetical protein
MGVEADGAAWRQTTVECFGYLSGCPDEDVGIPDGRHAEFGVGHDDGMLARARKEASSFADIAVIGTDGKGLKVLTGGKGNNGFPSWSPDGRRLVYHASDGKTGGLFILDVKTGEAKALKTGSPRDKTGGVDRIDMGRCWSRRKRVVL